MPPPSDRIYFERFQGIQASPGQWFKHIEILGSGGNAITSLVVSTSEPLRGGLFAMKIFKKLTIPKRRERFLKESAFLQDCSHPNVMRTFDSGNYRYSTDGRDYDYPFVIAEYLPSTLEDVMRENSASIAEKISYVLQILSALHYLHTLQPAVIHRDIKPANIFVKGGTCVLGDFGLLKLVGQDQRGDPNAFRESLGGAIPWAYRTPDLVEYAKGLSQLTTSSDIFQLGLVAAELFTGRNPCVKPKNMLDQVQMHSIGHVPRKLGKGIANLINRMLDIVPSERTTADKLMSSWEKVFWSAIELSHDLEGHAFKKKG